MASIFDAINGGLRQQATIQDRTYAPVDLDAEAIAAQNSTDGALGRGLNSGLRGAGGQLRALAGGVAEAVGAKELAAEQYARSAAAQQDAAALAPEISSYKQVNDVGSGLRYAAGLAGQSAPMLGAGLAAGALTRGQGLRALGAATAAVAPFEIGGAIERQQADPVALERSAQERLGIAAGEGVVSSALQNVVPLAMGGKLVPKAAGAGAKETAAAIIAKNAAEGIGGNAVAGATAEKLHQEVGGYLNPNRDTSHDTDNLKEAAVGGAVIGAPFGAVGAAGELARSRARPATAVDQAKELFTGRSKEPVDLDFAKKMADGSETIDPAAAAAASADPALGRQVVEADAQTRLDKAAQWGAELMKEKFPPDVQEKLHSAITTIGDGASQAYIASLKAAKDIGQQVADKVNQAFDSLPKRSEDNTGARAAITDAMTPILKDTHPELFTDAANAGKLADTVRSVIDKARTDGRVASDVLTKLKAVLGDKTREVLTGVHDSVLGHDDPVATENFYKVMNKLAESDSQHAGLAETVRSSLKPELANTATKADIDAAVGFLRDYVNERHVGNMTPSQAAVHKHDIRQALVEHFGAKTDKVIEAFAADTIKNNKKSTIDDRAPMAEAEHGAVDAASQYETPQFYGKGKDSTGIIQSEAAHQQTYGNDKSPARDLLNKARTENPDRNVSFVDAKDLPADHPGVKAHLAEGKSLDGHGIVVAEGMKQEGRITRDELNAMKLDTTKTSHLDSASRIDTGANGITLDAKRVAKEMHAKLEYNESDDKSSMHRLARTFTEGIAAAQDHLGKTFEVPDSVVVATRGGKDITYGELKKLSMRPEDAAWMKDKSPEEINERLRSDETLKTSSDAELKQYQKTLEQMIDHRETLHEEYIAQLKQANIRMGKEDYAASRKEFGLDNANKHVQALARIHDEINARTIEGTAKERVLDGSRHGTDVAPDSNVHDAKTVLGEKGIGRKTGFDGEALKYDSTGTLISKDGSLTDIGRKALDTRLNSLEQGKTATQRALGAKGRILESLADRMPARDQLELARIIRGGDIGTIADVINALTDKYKEQRTKMFVDAMKEKYAPGMDIKVVESDKLPSGGAGSLTTHADGSFTLTVKPGLTPVQFGATVAHEFGHALQHHIFDKAPESVQKAIRGEWQALVDKYKGDSSLTVEDYNRDFRHAGVAVSDKFAGKSARDYMSALDAKAKEITGKDGYSTSFNEYFANQFSKYMSSGAAKDAPKEVKAFWQDAVRLMKEYFDKVVSKFTPNAEFKAWADSLASKVAIRDDSSMPPSNKASTLAERVLSGGGSLKTVLDKVKTASDPKALQAAVIQLTSLKGKGNEHSAKAIDAINARISELIQDSNKAYNLQRAGAKEIGADEKIAIVDHIEKVLGKDVKVEFAKLLHAGDYTRGTIGVKPQDLIRVSVHSLDPMSVAYHESLHAFMQHMREADIHNANSVLFKAADSAPVKNQLKKLLAGEPEALKQIESSAEERAAYMYQFFANGKLTLGDGATGVLQRISDFFHKITGMWTNDQRAIHIMGFFNSGEYAANMGDRNAVARALFSDGNNKVFSTLKDAFKPLARLSDTVLAAGDARLRDTNNPALTELADKLQAHTTGTGADVGFISAARIQRTQMLNGLTEKFANVKREDLNSALEALQTKTPASTPEARKVQTAVRELLDNAYTYMKDAGVNVKDLGFKKDYFPVVWDPSYIAGHQKEFLAMIDKYAQAGKFAGSPKELLARLMRNDGSELGIEIDRPGMQHVKERVLDFIDPADRAPFLQKDMMQTLGSYVTQATRRAEWARRFGDDNAGLKRLMQDAETNGATPDQMKLAQQYVKGIDGSLGDDISPATRKLFGNMLVYQNVRLLPLAVFSMAVDPGGILVRGGTVGDAFNAFKRGIMEIPRGFKKDPSKDEWHKLAETMGVIDNHSLVHTLGSSYSQGMVGDTGRKINDAFFRYNLVEQMNTSMRVSALPAALGFLAKHADGTASQHSERWLAELGLKAGDVVVKDGRPLLHADEFIAAGFKPNEAAEKAAIMTMAVNKWVDGAILRPNAAHKPLWMNDPHFALVSHLKQFVYSFNETIIKRVVNEAQHGNYTPAYALASYVPIMMAADFMKGMIQGGGDQPEWKQDWDFADYVGNGMQRAGLFGVGQFPLDAAKDIRRGGTGIGAFAGPTLEQLADGVKTAGGKEQFKTFAMNSMPANALVKPLVSRSDGPDPVFAE